MSFFGGATYKDVWSVRATVSLSKVQSFAINDEHVQKHPTPQMCLVSDFMCASYVLTRVSVFLCFMTFSWFWQKDVNSWRDVFFLMSGVSLVWHVFTWATWLKFGWCLKPVFIIDLVLNGSFTGMCVGVCRSAGTGMSFLTTIDMLLPPLSTIYEGIPLSSQHIYFQIPPFSTIEWLLSQLLAGYSVGICVTHTSET